MLTAADREAIRRNVGYPNPGVRLHAGTTTARPLLLQAGRARAAPLPTIKPAAGVLTATIGHAYHLAMATNSGARVVKATPRIGYPFQLRQVLVVGNATPAEPFSYRILVSDDADTTAVEHPTGQDVIIPLGDRVGLEDLGLHPADFGQAVEAEPWYLEPVANRVIKVKTHNLAASTRNLYVYLALDELAAE
jgi:hypothetical protein